MENINNNENTQRNRYCVCHDNSIPNHVHEIEDSVRLAELTDDPHNHRFAGVTSEVIWVPGGHIHELHTKTDFYENHYHLVSVKTGLPVNVGEGKDARHIHYIDSVTDVADGHYHEFISGTLIVNPIGD